MEDRPLLSILIPTRNREEYALRVICHILNIRDDRFQLIIYNNSDTDKLKTMLSGCLADPRIQYFYHDAILSFVDNFSFGIGKCDGEYITIIGDDDGINPLIMDIVEWAGRNGVEAITPSLQLIYNWPGSGVNAESGNGRLTISDISCKIKFCDPGKEVVRLLKNGCQNYLSFNLAKVYHGIIKKSVLEEIKTITGHYIGGLSPDIYLSIAASLLIKKVLVIDYPLTISGICKNSGSADYGTGKHTGAIEEAPHFRGHANYQWSDKIPKFYSGETIWGDSALAAIHELKYEYLMRFFNADIITAYCMKGYPQFSSVLIENLAKHHKISQSSILIKMQLLKGFIQGPLLARIRAVIKQRFNKKNAKSFDNISDIENATGVIKTEIGNKNGLILNRLEKLYL